MKWIETPSKGIRYREHPTRKIGKVKKDRYYAIRYQKDCKRKEEGLGWASEGWTLDKATSVLIKLKEAAQKGEGPTRLSERREIELKRKESEQVEQERLKRENVTFGDFTTDTYLPQCKSDKKKKTYVNEEGLYRLHLSETIGKLPFNMISAIHLERIKKDMTDKKLSNRTIQYVLQLVRQVFHAARKLGVYQGESPTRNIRWPKLDNMKLRYLSSDEAVKLLSALETRSKNLHDVALLSLHCGLRFGEIANLKWSCVNLEAKTLTILNAKAGSRIAYLTEGAKEMLEGRERGKQNEFVFKKRSGKKGAMEQASKVFNDAVDSLKLNEGITDIKQRITFHSLRHSYATHLYESTHDLYLTQRSLGHTTGEMTKRYAKMSESRLREGAEAVEKSLSKKNSGHDHNGQAVNA